MEAILHTFGIDVRLIIIQIVNFALLAVALWYFLYTPVLNLLREREERIKRGVEDAEAAKEKLARADEERREVVSAAHKEAEEVAARAKEFADERSKEILAAAEDKAAQTIDDAQKKRQELKEAAIRESEAEVAKLAVLAAERVIRERQ